jgi:hypothetical protein
MFRDRVELVSKRGAVVYPLSTLRATMHRKIIPHRGGGTVKTITLAAMFAVAGISALGCTPREICYTATYCVAEDDDYPLDTDVRPQLCADDGGTPVTDSTCEAAGFPQYCSEIFEWHTADFECPSTGDDDDSAR